MHPKNLLLRYTICHPDILRGSKSFGKLLENGGSLMKDYVHKLMQVSEPVSRGVSLDTAKHIFA